MSAHLGWGPPGCTREQLVRVRVPGMVDSPPYFPLMVRREVAPLFEALCLWLVTERARRRLPPLTCSGGYNLRKQRGSATKWSNHSWGLAADFAVATNPQRKPLRTDMPPGTSEKARSLGMEWGGNWTRLPDPMHFEVITSPPVAAKITRALTVPPPPVKPEETPAMIAVYRAIRRVEDGAIALVSESRFRHVDGPTYAAMAAGGLINDPADDVNGAEWDQVKAFIGEVSA